MKLALIGSDKESVSSESLEYLLNMGLVFGHIARVDKNVVQVDDDRDINHICENIVHESLKGCGCIGKPFRHVMSHNTLVTLLTKLPASSGSRCHFPSHSEIPGTYVSCSNLVALPVTPSTDMSRCFWILQITEDIWSRPYLLF